MKKKSQITIFIILILIVVISIVFVIMISEDVQKKKSEANYRRVAKLNEDKKVIESYLRDCFEHSAKLNLMEIGLQGGVFYESQMNGEGGREYKGPNLSNGDSYGNEVVPFWYNSSEKGEVIYNLTYAIKYLSKINDDDGYTLDKALYNHKALFSPFGHEVSGSTSELSYTNDFPILCMTDGPNQALMLGANYSCTNYGSDDEKTIQYLLDKKITVDTIKCFEKELFKDKVPLADLELINKENASSDVLFGEDNVYVKLNMPVRVTFNYPDFDEKPVLNRDELIIEVPIRFKNVYELVIKILREDANNIFFNLNKAGEDNKSMPFCEDYQIGDAENTKVDCFRDGMSFEIIKNACEYTNQKYSANVPCYVNANKSTFLIVRDNKSYNLYSEPFMFVTVVGNRPPILDLVDYKLDNKTKYYDYLTNNYNISGNNINTTPERLYKQTRSPIISANDSKYNIILDWDKILYIIPRAIDPDEDFDFKKLTIMNTTYNYSGWNSSSLMGSSFYTDGAVGYLKYANNLIKNKDVNLTLSRSDLGEHQINITIKDVIGKPFERSIKLQVRCFDALRGFDNNSERNITLKNRWHNGTFYSNNGVNLTGDYNFSALSYSQIDINDSNDCCNESAGFSFSNDGHKCDTCHRCLNGICMVNATAGNIDGDCGAGLNCNSTGGCSS
jgi:hypothetical protein